MWYDSFLFALVDHIQSTQHKRIAVALFPNIAMVNHSCTPNSFFTFAGRQAKVRNSQSIRGGDEICISYGPTEASMPSCSERKEALNSQYHFQCGCDACTRRYRLVSELIFCGGNTTCEVSSKPWKRYCTRTGVQQF